LIDWLQEIGPHLNPQSLLIIAADRVGAHNVHSSGRHRAEWGVLR